MCELDGWVVLPISSWLWGVSLPGSGRRPAPKFTPNSPPGCPTSNSRGVPALGSALGRSRQLLQPRELGSGTDLPHLAPQPRAKPLGFGQGLSPNHISPVISGAAGTAAALDFDAGCSHGNRAGSGFVLTHPGTSVALTNRIFNRSLYWILEMYVL